MSDSVVLKEFLVVLGYKVDESAEKKFVNGITTATKAVMNLGVRVEATALAVAYGVARFASNLEALYFAAQRTDSSAGSLKAFGLAAQNFGASVDDAMGSVENLAAFLRNQPGGANVIEGWLGRVGLSMKGVKSDEQRLAIIGKMFALEKAQGQWFLANQQAGALGISDRMALAMASPGFSDELAKQEKRAKGWDAIAAAAHRFMVQLRDLKMQLEQTFLPFQGQAMAALQGLMTQFSKFLRDHGKQVIYDLAEAFKFLIRLLGELLDWLDSHGDEIQGRIKSTFGEFKSVFEVVKPAMEWVYNQFVKLDSATDGWSTKLFVLIAALKMIGAIGLVTGIANIGAGLAKAFGGVVGAAAAGGEWTVAGTLFGTAAAGAIGYAIGTLVYSLMPEWMQRKIGDAEGFAEDFLDKEIEKFRKHRANAVASTGGTDANADWNDTHYPWQKPPASSPVTVNTNVTIHGATDPQKTAQLVGGAVFDANRRARLESSITREFLATVR